jgi:small multidrug resistance family-3 protein
MLMLPALLMLVLAALLEAGGDALVRKGLGTSGLPRGLFFGAGAATLFIYGVIVNLPGWDFGRLLGVYVALFFMMAQVIAWIGFGQPPTAPILAGGALIVAGGLVMTFWQA